MDRATFIDHLEELRKRLLYSIVCVGVLSGTGFFFSRKILDFLIRTTPVKVAYFFSPTEAFMAQIKVAIFAGLFISFPFILYQTWAFIGPALTRKEQKVSFSYLVTGVLLFLTGLAFGYFVLIPFGLKFLFSFGTDNLQPLINVSKVLGFMLWGLLGAGLLFQLPLLVFFLIKLNIVSLKTVAKRQAEAIVIILAAVAIITPSADAFSMLIIALPLLLLYELSILVAWLSFRNRKRDKGDEPED
jgi:sec-independent protein translocase protein TatC